VIADAYYEWSDQNKPYLVFLQNKNRPFAFAGIYDHWQNPESKEIVTSFAIITTTANSLLQSIGVKRMPIILSRHDEAVWVKSSAHLLEIKFRLKSILPALLLDITVIKPNPIPDEPWLIGCLLNQAEVQINGEFSETTNHKFAYYKILGVKHELLI